MGRKWHADLCIFEEKRDHIRPYFLFTPFFKYHTDIPHTVKNKIGKSII